MSWGDVFHEGSKSSYNGWHSECWTTHALCTGGTPSHITVLFQQVGGLPVYLETKKYTPCGTTAVGLYLLLLTFGGGLYSTICAVPSLWTVPLSAVVPSLVLGETKRRCANQAADPAPAHLHSPSSSACRGHVFRRKTRGLPWNLRGWSSRQTLQPSNPLSRATATVAFSPCCANATRASSASRAWHRRARAGGIGKGSRRRSFCGCWRRVGSRAVATARRRRWRKTPPAPACACSRICAGATRNRQRMHGICANATGGCQSPAPRRVRSRRCAQA